MLLTVAIVAMLAAIAVPSFMKAREAAQRARRDAGAQVSPRDDEALRVDR